MLILLLANLSLHHYCIHNSDSVFSAHTNVMGNELADEAAKVSVRQFDELPAAMKISVTLGAVAPRPPF